MAALLPRSTASSHLRLVLPHHGPRKSPRPMSLILRLPIASRAFHASPPSRYLDTLLTGTHDLLSSIHSVTHLPWAYTLPLSALLVRLCITLPLTLYSRRTTQQQLNLHPLLHTWAHQIRRDTMARSGHRGPALVDHESRRSLRLKRQELYRRWGCGYWKNYIPVAQLPVWLLLVETIRGMCGIHKGILGLMASSATSTTAAVSAATIGSTDSVTTQDESIPTTSSITDPTAPNGQWPTDLFSSPLTTHIPTEPSLATEGFLWFPDLTAPDPLLILPFLLSASMFLNIYSGQRRGTTNTTAWRRRTTRALGLVALAVGPLTLQMPSAMLLYWFSSSMLAYGQSMLLDRLRPLRMPVEPCKPGVRAGVGLSSSVRR